jgi:hypothetical protein
MPEKKPIWQQLTPMNMIMLVIMVVGGLSTYFTLKNNIENHLENDEIHLTEEQRINLTKLTTIFDYEVPNIKKHTESIYKLEKDFAIFETSFAFYFNELNDLESKVSRNYVELNDKIEN